MSEKEIRVIIHAVASTVLPPLSTGDAGVQYRTEAFKQNVYGWKIVKENVAHPGQPRCECVVF